MKDQVNNLHSLGLMFWQQIWQCEWKIFETLDIQQYVVGNFITYICNSACLFDRGPEGLHETILGEIKRCKNNAEKLPVHIWWQ